MNAVSTFGANVVLETSVKAYADRRDTIEAGALLAVIRCLILPRPTARVPFREMSR